MPINENIIQIPSMDGCIYLFNPETNKWRKICDIDSPFRELPFDVQERIKNMSISISHSNRINNA